MENLPLNTESEQNKDIPNLLDFSEAFAKRQQNKPKFLQYKKYALPSESDINDNAENNVQPFKRKLTYEEQENEYIKDLIAKKQRSQDVAERDAFYCEQLLKLRKNTAEEIIKWSGSAIILPNLRSAEPGALDILAQWKGEYLSIGMQSFFTEDFHSIILWKGKQLELGLINIHSDEAKIIASWTGEALRLQKLAFIDELTAAELAQFNGNILDLGVYGIHWSAARKLSSWKGEVLSLPNLKKIDDETAKCLAKFKGKIIAPDSVIAHIEYYKQSLVNRIFSKKSWK